MGVPAGVQSPPMKPDARRPARSIRLNQEPVLIYFPYVFKRILPLLTKSVTATFEWLHYKAVNLFASGATVSPA